MPRKKTIRRFEEWASEPANIDEFFRLILDGGVDEEGKRKPLRFRDACVALNVPYTLMYPLVHNTAELKERYDAVLRAKAHDYQEETIEIADSVRGSTEPAEVGAAKLAIEARQVAASRLDRERFGDPKETGRITAPVILQIASLRGDVSVAATAPAALPRPLESTDPSMDNRR